MDPGATGRRRRVESYPQPPEPTTYRRLLRVGRATAAILVLSVAAYATARALARLAPVTMAVIAALLLSALIAPMVRGLRHLRVPRSAAALLGVVVLIATLAGASYLIGHRAASQLDDLQTQVVEGIGRLRETLLDALPGLDRDRLDQIAGSLVQALRDALPSPYAGVTSATEVLAAVLLAVVLLFFFLRDGDRLWHWITGLVPEPWTERVDRAGNAAWRTLASYTHGIVAVAAVDAIGIGVTLLLLHVPLALSLAVLTFLAAFVPIIGATVAGAAATLVTLVTNGTRDALLVLAAVILVQQAEGNLLHPVIMRRAVRLHPVVTLLAVSIGTLMAGIAGALIAVPLCAVSYHAVLGYQGRDPSDRPAAGPDDRTRKDTAGQDHAEEPRDDDRSPSDGINRPAR